METVQLTAGQEKRVQRIVEQVVAHYDKYYKDYPPRQSSRNKPRYSHWYVGVSGQDDDDKYKSQRVRQHRTPDTGDYKKLVIRSIGRWDGDAKVVYAAESRLRELGFHIGVRPSPFDSNFSHLYAFKKR